MQPKRKGRGGARPHRGGPVLTQEKRKGEPEPNPKGEDGKAHDYNIIVKNIDKYALPTLGKGIGPSFSSVVWPFLLLGRVGLLSRGEDWPFSGLKLGLVLPSWGRGWPFLLGVGVVQLCVIIIKI